MPTGTLWTKGFEYDRDDVVMDAYINAMLARNYGNGVIYGYANELAVSPNSPADMTVLIGTGKAQLADGTVLEITTQQQLTLTAPTTDNRYDIIVINSTNPNGAVIQGTESANPVPPDLPENTVLLATILLTPTTTSISSSDIRDCRIFMSTIVAERIKASAVRTSAIADGAVTTAKIANDAVDATKIASGAVGNAELASGAVDSTKIASGAISDSHVNASAGIAESKLSFDSVGGHDHDGTNSKKVAHSSLSGIGTDDHHPKAHAHDGVDGSGTVAHSSLTGIGANDHHNQQHNLASTDHPDVDIASPSANQLLFYDGATSKWKNKSLLGDVTLDSSGKTVQEWRAILFMGPGSTITASKSTGIGADVQSVAVVNTTGLFQTVFTRSDYWITVRVNITAVDAVGGTTEYRVVITSGSNVYDSGYKSVSATGLYDEFFNNVSFGDGTFKIELYLRATYADGPVSISGRIETALMYN